MKDELQKKIWLGNVLLFGILILLGNYVSAVFLYAAVIICLIQLCVCNEEYNFIFSVFLIPNIRILDGTGISFLVNLIMVLPFIKLLFTRRFIRRDVLIVGVALFLVEFAHILTVGNYSSLPKVICWALSFLYCITVALSDDIHVNNEKLHFGFTTGILFSAGVYLLSNLSYAGNLLPSIFGGERFEAYASDPNYYSLYICLSVALLFTLEKKTVWHYVSVLLILVIGLLTASKMCLLLSVTIILIAIMLQFARTNQQGAFVRRLCGILVAACVIFWDYLLRFINNLLRRAGLSDGADASLSVITTGRSSIVQNYIDILSTNTVLLLLGGGFAYHEHAGEIKGYGAHNTYLDVLLAWGIFGLIAVVCIVLFFAGSIYAKRGRKRGIIYALPVLSLMLSFLSLSCFNATMFWWVIVIAILAGTKQKAPQPENQVTEGRLDE